MRRQPLVAVFADVGRFLTLCARSRSALAAENLFLRKQLALYEERKVRPHLATDAFRFVMCALGRLFEWRQRTPRGQARHVYPLAPEGISPVLAVEVQAERPAHAAAQPSRTHPPDGGGQPGLG